MTVTLDKVIETLAINLVRYMPSQGHKNAEEVVSLIKTGAIKTSSLHSHGSTRQHRIRVLLEIEMELELGDLLNDDLLDPDPNMPLIVVAQKIFNFAKNCP